MKALRYIKPSKRHSFGGPGIYMHIMLLFLLFGFKKDNIITLVAGDIV